MVYIQQYTEISYLRENIKCDFSQMVTKALREFRVAVSSGVNRGKGVEKRETSGAKKLGRWRSVQKIYSLE